MAENNEFKPQTTDGYTEEGRTLEQESLAPQYPTEKASADDEALGAALEAETLSGGEPAVVATAGSTATAADADALAGAALEAAELSPAEPVAPQPYFAAPAQAGYTAEGRALEQEALPASYPIGQPASQPALTAAPVNAAYHATYGAPQQPASTPMQNAGPTPAPASGQAYPTAAPHAAATAAAVQKVRKPLDPVQVFHIYGMVVGAIIMVFGLCMLAYYTPDAAGSMFDSYQMNGSAGFSSTGATSAQVIKGGFAMLLIGFGATDICAFGARYMKTRGHGQK
ncbi:hypothetical protein [Adlercreutzia shanghongiae]|uniref:Uncharacterized protein n=1 Tax=Adlercreutzia shanghongiae TaxID=3111773 RepID=A0ABU6J185_9ACTN|nr:hypothetical protein [Adlercreutzia sp. R22]MEC4295896.1 hypothetical protein [Adlercreutzia sp. R22]